MNKQNNIRNISIIANIDDEASTIYKSLNSRASITIINKNKGELCTELMKKTEQDSTNSLLYYEMNHSDIEQVQQKTSGKSFLYNLIDSQKPDSYDATSTLRITDGVVVVIDCVDGLCLERERMLSEAVLESVKPIVFIDRLDRLLLGLRLDREKVYQKLSGIMRSINVLIHAYGKDSPLGEITISPSLGNVGFGSSLQEWGFSLKQFAKVYAERFHVEARVLMKRFWGDHFYSASEYRWRKESRDGYERGFSLFILDPILKLVNSILSFNKEELLRFLQILDIQLDLEEQKLEEKALVKVCMRRWLPLEDTMLQMIAIHLPSPATAQSYRMNMLYEGPCDDDAAIGIKHCDAKAPVMIYISKIVASDKKGMNGFGRIFSGTIATGQQVRIVSPFNNAAHKEDAHSRIIHVTEMNVGSSLNKIEDVPCGNLFSISDADQSIWGTCTVTTFQKAHPLRTSRYGVNHVVRVTVEPKFPKDLPKLVEGLTRLTKTDPFTDCIIEDSGEHSMAGTGELHLERCLKILTEEIVNTIPLIVSEPIVSYRETVSEMSEICLAKSPNKHNRLFCQALPLNDSIALDIDKNIMQNKSDRSLVNQLYEKYGWSKTDAKKIWAFGPENNGPNLLVDCTKGVQYTHEIRDSVVAGFQWPTKEGVLCNEKCRGIRFNLHDVVLNYDAIHRGGGQIIPTARRVFYASILTAKPRILEPVYLCHIKCPQEDIFKVYQILDKGKGYIIDEDQQMDEASSCLIKSCIPVRTSSGFTADLRSGTGGRAHHHFAFDHWELVSGDPLDALTKNNCAALIVAAIRKRKGLSESISPLDRFKDKL